MRAFPSRVLVERAAAGDPLVATLERNMPRAVFRVVEELERATRMDPDVLEVVRFRGRFLKPCPGTRHYCCCGYRILHFGTQCTLGCTYCVLQAYLNHPNLRLFSNTDEMLGELERTLAAHPRHLFRIGTGEFTDSLLLDPCTGLSPSLVNAFAGRSNAVLELKTKTDFIENLEGVGHGGNTLLAWSLNAPSVCRREESRAAGLQRRLDAARSAQEWGYFLAFHFDPMIHHPGWREGYGEVLDRLFDAVDPSRVVWISLGALRFMPELGRIMRARHPRSPLPYGEFVRGLDDKMRYFRDIRVELYRFMVERIRTADPELCVYLCMEGLDVWREAFGFSPDEGGGLPAMLDRAVKDRMGVGRDCPFSADDLEREDEERMVR